MAITAFGEAVQSREGTDGLLTYDGEASLRFIGHSDASDITQQEIEILTETLTSAPVEHLGLPRTPPQRRELGSGWWEITIPYSQQKKKENEENEPQPVGSQSQFQFTFQGVTQRIRQSIALSAKTAAAPGTLTKSEPIGWDGERVNGADIIIPQASFAETHHFEVAYVTDAKKFTWLRLVGKTNAAAFRNAAIGECLLTRISGTQQGSAPWEITFEFAFSENATETFTIFPAGGGAPSDEAIAVKGHELLDFGYEGAVITNQKINRLIWVQVHQVYKTGNYADLGI